MRDDLAIGQVVVHDQHPCAVQAAGAQLAQLGRVGRQRHGEEEGGAHAWRAADIDLAAHQLHQLLADREPEAGAAVLARGGIVFLREGFEDCGQVLRLYALARVLDLEAHQRTEQIAADLACADFDFAALGELHRVAEQVDDHLPQSLAIAAHRDVELRGQVADQLQPLDVRALGQDLDRILDDIAQVVGRLVELELAGLNLREIEDVVDDAEQRVTRLMDRGGIAALPLIQAHRMVQQLGHAQYAIHGRADLMAHARQEIALGAIGLFGALHGFLCRDHRGIQAGSTLAHTLLEFVLIEAQVHVALFQVVEDAVDAIDQRAQVIVGGALGAQREILVLAHLARHLHQRADRLGDGVLQARGQREARKSRQHQRRKLQQRIAMHAHQPHHAAQQESQQASDRQCQHQHHAQLRGQRQLAEPLFHGSARSPCNCATGTGRPM